MPSIELKHSRILLRVRPGASEEKKQALFEAWYRAQLKKAVLPLLAKWEQLMGVKVNRVFVQRMKTKWGSCNHKTGCIRLNTELVKKPKDLLEYVIVHEMIHLIEPRHSEHFMSLLATHYPTWREARLELNELPLAAEVWAGKNEQVH